MRHHGKLSAFTGQHYTCQIDPHGILAITVLENDTPCSLEEVRKLLEMIPRLNAQKRHPVLADIRKGKFVPFGTFQEIGQSSMALRAVSAAALLVESPLSKLIGSFFIGIHRPPFPVKLFRCRELALQWLLKVSPDVDQPLS